MTKNQENNLKQKTLKAIEEKDMKNLGKLLNKINHEVSDFYGFDVDLFTNKQNKNK